MARILIYSLLIYCSNLALNFQNLSRILLEVLLLEVFGACASNGLPKDQVEVIGDPLKSIKCYITNVIGECEY